MFDTIQGLPVHPLVVHAAVVLGPLAAVLLLTYVAVPRWRMGLRWPTLILALAAAGSAWAAEQSGEALQVRIGVPGFEHAQAGELAVQATMALAAATALVVLWLNRPGARSRFLGFIGLLLAVAAAGFAGYAGYEAGHSGASSVWLNEIADAMRSIQP